MGFKEEFVCADPNKTYSCMACCDRGYYWEAPQIIGDYPPGTPLSQRLIVEPKKKPCPCQSVDHGNK